MRLVLSAFFLGLVLVLSGCSGGKDSPVAKVERLTSPAGHEFLYAFMPDVDTVAFNIAWQSGWAYNADRNPVVPHIGAQLMLAGGAGEMNPAELGERFADLNAEARIVAGADYVRGGLKVRKDRLDEALPLINAVLTAPALDAQWLGRVRSQFESNIAQARTQSTKVGGYAAVNAILGDQPLRAFFAPDVVEAVSREDVLSWWRETFVTDGTTIAVAGNISAEEAALAIDRGLAGLANGARKPGTSKADANFAPRTVLLHRPRAKKTVLTLAGQLPPTREGDEYEDLLAVLILGNGDKSHLFEAVRTRLRASYGFQAGLFNYTRDLRAFVITGEVDTDRLGEVREAVRQTYAELRANGASEAELKATKLLLSQQIGKNLRDPATIVHLLVEAALDGLEASRVLKLTDELDAVSGDSVRRRLAEAFPLADGLVEIVVSPVADAVPGACVVTEPSEAVKC